MSTSVCVCLSVREHISGTTRAIFTNFSVHVAQGRALVFLRQVTKCQGGRGNFRGCPGHSKSLAIFAASVAAAFAAEGIIQSPITSCSRRDHRVYQASANRNRENSEHRRSGLSAVKGVMEVHSAGESDMYDYLVNVVFCRRRCFRGSRCAVGCAVESSTRARRCMRADRRTTLM